MRNCGANKENWSTGPNTNKEELMTDMKETVLAAVMMRWWNSGS